MLVNKSILKNVHPKLSTALKVLDGISNFNIKVIPTKKTATENIDSIVVGADNALSGGRADFSADKVLSLINKAMNIPAFPKSIKYKKVAKGHTLFIEVEKIEDNGNHNH